VIRVRELPPSDEARAASARRRFIAPRSRQAGSRRAVASAAGARTRPGMRWGRAPAPGAPSGRDAGRFAMAVVGQCGNLIACRTHVRSWSAPEPAASAPAAAVKVASVALWGRAN
jgi:hypothetical protein